MANVNDVEIGSVVKVRGIEGPRMVVEAVDVVTSKAACMWFDREGTVNEWEFQIETLELVETPRVLS